MKPTTFQIGRKKYVIRDLTIRDYYEMQLEMTMSDSETGFSIVSRLSGCPIDVLRSLSYEQWLALWLTVQEKIKVTNSLDGQKSTPIVTINGVKYGFVTMDKMSIGEFSDLDVLLNSPNVDSRIHEVMAILYRPVTFELFGKYKIAPYTMEDYEERCEIFKDFPMIAARTAISFFLRSASTSLKVTLGSLSENLEEPIKSTVKEINQILIGLREGGTQQSLDSLTKTHSRLKELLDSLSEKYSISLAGDQTTISEESLK